MLFGLFGNKKTQPERVLELLLRHGTVTSLQLSQMHPVILNFHEAIHALRRKHNIETVVELVKGVKHTSYIYHGRNPIPTRCIRERKYTREEAIKIFNAWLNLEAPNAEAYLETLG